MIPGDDYTNHGRPGFLGPPIEQAGEANPGQMRDLARAFGRWKETLGRIGRASTTSPAVVFDTPCRYDYQPRIPDWKDQYREAAGLPVTIGTFICVEHDHESTDHL